MTEEVTVACEDYRQYVKNILVPASEDLHTAVESMAVLLHQVYGINLVTAHSIDYLLAIRVAATGENGRSKLVKRFDELYSVPGANLRNRKMELIDAINNGLKHIRLDPARYKEVSQKYGGISFRSLMQHEGRILCLLERYRFDYCRVVLLPALNTLVSAPMATNEDALAFATEHIQVLEEDLSYSSYVGGDYDDDDPSTAIDRAIEMFNPPCANCEEYEEACICSEYKFDDKPGEFTPMFIPTTGEMDYVLSQISPSWRRS
ncbi:hypothetical protein CEJ42_16915 [Herbaspirillum robiniae]|uniref:Uncharacterized protein n=2 Tax=Herbaspirillum robiniae TaxID=2014887 RepID=A0A246WNM8_9BURK|nr:hypothetical protein CEJ42_16915 [Herbaspirillum robiniae]